MHIKHCLGRHCSFLKMYSTGVLCLLLIVGCSGVPKPAQLSQPRQVYSNWGIVNGENAEIEEFPWQGSLTQGVSHNCGLVVIGDQRAITAAHCVSGSMSIRVGSSFHLRGGQQFNVSEYVVHPLYDPSKFPNDIAVLKFDVKITGDGAATAASLPNADNDYDGDICDITGWGRTGGIDPLPDQLQRAKTYVMSNADCEDIWPEEEVTAGNVCLRNNETGACFGDSGGPLSCGQVVVGVTSWGSGSCDISFPSVYTRVSEFLDFINENL